MKAKFQGLLDERNLGLWKDLKMKYPIELEESSEPGYLSKFQDAKVVILFNINNINPASFTHELLHIYLKLKGVFIAIDLKERIDSIESLSGLFSTSLKIHLGNCLEHQKMLPIFLNLGFKNNEFLMDFDKKIMDENQLGEIITSYYKNGVYSRKIFDTLTGKYFSMKASNNRKFNYDTYFKCLKKTDPILLHTHEEFWNNWLKFKIGDPKERYREFLDDFMEQLISWNKDKIWE